MRRLLSSVAFVALAGPAAACINDIELPGHEREFRSQYNKPAEPPAAPISESAEPGGQPVAGIVAGGFGVVLLVGATVVALRGPAARG